MRSCDEFTVGPHDCSIHCLLDSSCFYRADELMGQHTDTSSFAQQSIMIYGQTDVCLCLPVIPSTSRGSVTCGLFAFDDGCWPWAVADAAVADLDRRRFQPISSEFPSMSDDAAYERIELSAQPWCSPTVFVYPGRRSRRSCLSASGIKFWGA